MSLGGLPSPAMEAALNDAVAKNLIVIVAAGNCVRQVTFPARYPNAIAVGGSKFGDQPWRGTCRGSTVAISAPAEAVYHAAPFDAATGTVSTTRVNAGQGTSFAAAAVAGVAALWIAAKGRSTLMDFCRKNRCRLQSVFRDVLREHADVPPGWNTAELGAGIVDAEAVVKAPLTDRQPDMPVSLGSPLDPLRLLFPISDAAELLRNLLKLFGPAPALDLEALPALAALADGQRLSAATPQEDARHAELARYGVELTHAFLNDPGAFDRFCAAAREARLPAADNFELTAPAVAFREGRGAPSLRDVFPEPSPLSTRLRAAIES
jgi:hypothetical protein